ELAYGRSREGNAFEDADSSDGGAGDQASIDSYRIYVGSCRREKGKRRCEQNKGEQNHISFHAKSSFLDKRIVDYVRDGRRVCRCFAARFQSWGSREIIFGAKVCKTIEVCARVDLQIGDGGPDRPSSLSMRPSPPRLPPDRQIGSDRTLLL